MGAPRPTADRDLLRFLACGSVDDGKSTLIGRLLYETASIFDDQLAALARDSRTHGTIGDEIDLSLLMDGLEAERQQGITIDVAYRYFSTPRRNFIVADTPGHEQYTRNMATGASTADLAVILVDARKGVLVQTRRHSYICSLLGIRHIVLAVNKMDLVDFDESRFSEIVADYLRFAEPMGFAEITAIPLAARHGDNVVAPSPRTPWYDGPMLLSHLEDAARGADAAQAPVRFPVQWVNRPNADFRGFSGTLVSGRLAAGDTLAVAASGTTGRVARIVTAEGDLGAAEAGDAITLVLDREIDIARGDVLVAPDAPGHLADQFAAHVVWMSEEALLPGRSYLMRAGTQWLPVSVTAIKHKVDVNTLSHLAASRLELNEIGMCNLAAAKAFALDAYSDNRATGSFIIVDRFSFATVGAGMIDFPLRRATNIRREFLAVDKAAHAASKGQKPLIIWFTGLSGSGKSTIAKALERRLYAAGRHTYMLDGDNLRHGLNRDLGFTEADRVENVRRAGEVARLFVDAGLIVICAFISPFKAERELVRGLVAEDEFIEIFVDTPIKVCMERDPKGLYAKAKAGKLVNFTGIDSPYEAPDSPELRLDTSNIDVDTLAEQIVQFLAARSGD
ncbi:sulfate adenylyltransferase subunit CysN [Bosea sp. TWI1241]|uniref:sulfate adenylyltransferase subunit CysN n=1 Tax=Bosea sp. TWI1241 TaxID=3148904 RepID=UPI003208DA4F